MAEAKDKAAEAGFKVVDRRHSAEAEASQPTPAPSATPATATPHAPIDFNTFVLSFASTALIQMGVAPDPETGQTQATPDLARETIDLLGMLRDKTRGNLTDEESRFFDAMLYDLRVKFVEITQHKAN